MSNIDPIQLIQTTPSQGENLQLYKENPTIKLGKEKSYKLLQQDENPQFAISVCSSGPIGLWLYPVLRYSNSLKIITFFSLSKARVYYILARLCQLIAIFYLVTVSHILTTPYILSLVNYYYICFASPLQRPIKGVKGIYLF